MGKTRAEIQRQYRERKKAKEGEHYLERERERNRKNYVPIAARTKKDQKTRREKVRKYVQDHRMRKRIEQRRSVNADFLSENNSNECQTNNKCDENGVSSSTQDT